MRDMTLFNKCVENAERLLELQLLGWSYRSIHDVPSPLSLSEAVSAVMTSMKLDPTDTRCEKPQPTGMGENGRPTYGPELIMAMRTLNPVYGELRRHLNAKWQMFYEKRGSKYALQR